MSDYSEFFLNGSSSVVQLECLEIGHPDFSQTYYIVRNAPHGVTVTHEDATTHAYQYYPLRCSLTGPRDDLDQILKVQLGDLGDLIPNEIDNIRENDSFDEFPTVKYRVYASDDLTNVMYGPLLLEIRDFSLTREGCAFDAKAPTLNVNRTGERYTLPRFPMLRGAVK